MSSGLSEAIGLLTSSNNLHYQIWMFYVVVALGLLGFRFSETYEHLSAKKRLIIIVGFIAFAVSNFIAMKHNLSQFNQVLLVLKQASFTSYDLNFKTIFAHYNHKNPISILGFQALITIVLSYVLYKSEESK